MKFSRYLIENFDGQVLVQDGQELNIFIYFACNSYGAFALGKAKKYLDRSIVGECGACGWMEVILEKQPLNPLEPV